MILLYKYNLRSQIEGTQTLPNSPMPQNEAAIMKVTTEHYDIERLGKYVC